MAYFSVFGISNFANGSNGDQISFIDETGKVKTTTFSVPGQTFVKTGSYIYALSFELCLPSDKTAFHVLKILSSYICMAF